MKQDNQFQFVKNRQLENVTALQAEMNDFSYGKHAHEEYSFGVTLAGRQDFFSSGAFHRSAPGNVIVFNPGEVHDGHAGTPDTLHYRMLYIHPDQLEPMLAIAGIRPNKEFQISDNLIQDPTLRGHILSLSQMTEAQSGDKLAHESALFQLAERIAQLYSRFEPSCTISRPDRLLRQSREFIHASLTKNLSLDDLSREAGISKYHYLRLFRQQFGITPHQYILNCRINRAKEALENGADIDDVAFDYGFSDLSHFNRRFKPIYGMTPKQYQQLFLNA
ncbi:AraC family transcriptional regulator [Parasalinivibrio latis]|uniref:helix-turn-helix transcriptional regulator n=1 Tax=Parasalinivibrio latis TaxID=2952610 RepID=UPI0030DEF0D8